jgi:hypothetical protein
MREIIRHRCRRRCGCVSRQRRLLPLVPHGDRREI